jgi:hypothetical protein
MKQWLGLLILLAMIALAAFAYRRGMGAKREDRSDQDGMPPGVGPRDANDANN